MNPITENDMIDTELVPDEIEAETPECVLDFCYENRVELGAVEIFAENTNYDLNDIDSWGEEFIDTYCGEWESESDYAYDLASNIGFDGDTNQWPVSCIDWDKAWSELEYDGYWSQQVSWNTFYIFRSI